MPICAACGHELGAAARFCASCGSPVAAATAEQRKTVSILFCDLTGSTALGESLDPEALRAVLRRYFDHMRDIVERHGGTVEKFIGDAVMAVFGVPQAHEDDALRAVRAAAEMRDALPELGLQGRIGVTTGEVVTGTEERLATGDPVNVAARLEQAAAPGEVLLGEPTHRLVRDAVDVVAVEPLALKGKSQPVPAFRLLAVREAPERRHDTAFVGRERESASLLDIWGRAVGERRCELATIVADAGIGKSRLVAEIVAALDARVVRGRCLSYGDGVAYWPVVEVLKQLEVLPADENAATAIRSLLGESTAPTTADELAWAFRKTLERAAADAPLVVVFDDIQWGGDAALDLIEHVALFAVDVPLLLLCLARSELLERRPTWPVTLRLEPLTNASVEALVPAELAPGLRTRIVRAAGGNPLFVHEMVAMATDSDGDVSVPPSLQALLAARLDQLESPERAVLERGAVEGEIFHRGSIQALGEDEQVTPRLAALVRKQLIRPDRAQIPGDDGFRFRHLLIRDAAYDALPKAARADLHERFARWLEVHGQSLVELDEILAYHLDQACRYRADVGLAADPALVAAARERLRAAGVRAYAQTHDMAAAARAFARALELARDEVDLLAGVHLADSLYWLGRGDEALERIDAFASHAETAGDRRAVLCARLVEGTMLTFMRPEGATERLEALVAEAEPEFREAGDDFGLYVVAKARAQIANMRGRLDELAAAFAAVAEYGRRARLAVETLGWQATGRFHGTSPIPDLIAWVESLDPELSRSHHVRSRYAAALVMAGRTDEGKDALAAVRAELADRGDLFSLARLVADATVVVEALTGDLERAAMEGEAGCRQLEQYGDWSVLSSVAGRLACVLAELGRLDEAEAWAGRSRELGAEEDALTQMLWRQAEARVAARRGEVDEALALAAAAVEIATATDMLNEQADAYADLADVLERAGDPDAAADARRKALDGYERKGNVVSAERTRARLTS